jgi:tetratricopeptide (TPR) repeat protein
MNIGTVRLADGDPHEARRQFESAQRIRQRQLERHDDIKTRRDLAKGSYNLAILESMEGNADGSEKSLRDAITHFERVVEEDPRDMNNQHLLAICYRLLGDHTRATGEWTDALTWYERARARLQLQVDRNPDVLGYRVDLARLSLNLGDGQLKNEELDAALRSLQQARDLFAGLCCEPPDVVPTYQRDFAATLRSLANAQLQKGQPADARRNLETAEQLLQHLLDRFPDKEEFARELTATRAVLNQLGDEQPQQQ